MKRADDAYGFYWSGGLLDYVKKHDKPSREWTAFFAQKPPLLGFWYRQAAAPLTAGQFHDDLLTPGLVDQGDPPTTQVGMIDMVIDSTGRLLWFQRIPEQVQQPEKKAAAPPDWNALFREAGLDPAKFQTAEPLWNSLAAFDTRGAWTGTWPGTTRPIRIEAAAMRGRPVFFSIIEPWTSPDRAPGGGGFSVRDLILIAMVLAVFAGAPMLGRRNLNRGRGDRRGAFRLAAFVAFVQMGIWATRSHLAASSGTFGMFLLATCTSVFYGVVVWTVYLALEPYVRRHWPHALISWSSVLIGRLRDPIIGRDVLIGCALGASLPLINGLLGLWWRHTGDWTPGADARWTDILLGGRSTLAVCLTQVPHGIRDTLFYLFLIFLLRMLLRNQWLAGAAFALLFVALTVPGSHHPLLDGIATFVVLGSFAFVTLHWGLLPMAVGIVVDGAIEAVPVTANTSAWYFADSLLVLLGIVALAAWGFRTAVAGHQFWNKDLL